MADSYYDLSGNRIEKKGTALSRLLNEPNPTKATVAKAYELMNEQGWNDKNGKPRWRESLKLAVLSLKTFNFRQFEEDLLTVDSFRNSGWLGSDSEAAKIEIQRLKDEYFRSQSMNDLGCKVMLSALDENGERSSLPLKAGAVGALVGAGAGLAGGPFAEVSVPGGALAGFGLGSSAGSMYSRGKNTVQNSKAETECNEHRSTPWGAGEVTLEIGSVLTDMVGLGAPAVKGVQGARAIPLAKGPKALGVVGAPTGAGGVVRGAESLEIIEGTKRGPQALRDAGLIDALPGEVRDMGDARPSYLQRLKPVHFSEAERLGNNYRGVYNEAAALLSKVGQTLKAGFTPLVIGGDHALSLGSVPAVAKHYGQSVGVIWVDAHADINTFVGSLTKNIHGMPVSALTGIDDKIEAFKALQKISPSVNPKNLVYVALRELDPFEVKKLEEMGIKAYWMKDIKAAGGIENVMKDAIRTANNGTPGFVLSFDLDSISPTVVKAFGTPVEGGINFKTAKSIVSAAAQSGKTLSLEIVEYNPLLDTPGKKTAAAAISLAKLFQQERPARQIVNIEQAVENGLPLINLIAPAKTVLTSATATSSRKDQKDK